MSVLKRVIFEDLLPALRGRLPEPRPRSVSSACVVAGTMQGQTNPTPGEARSSYGMKAVILNWSRGENDPFTYVNSAIAHHFRASGKNVEVIEIADANWPRRLMETAENGGIEFAYTWQGLGSPATVGSPPGSLWERIGVPLICIHGDHPSHMPANHQLESRYCFHLYANADHARYSNRYFRCHRGATVIDIPILHLEDGRGSCTGDYFVLAKNISHPADIESVWRERLDKETLNVYLAAAEALNCRLAMPGHFEVHDALDELLASRGIAGEGLRPGTAGYHQYHSQLDHYVRSAKSVRAVMLLRDFPLRVYGRGWDRIAERAPPRHTFHRGQDMAVSQELFYTRFGVVDISPSKGLHDRTRRAMANGTGFLSSAMLDDHFPDLNRFESLFFDFGPDSLERRCAAVMVDPEGHRALAAEFGRLYHTRFHFRQFVARIDALAKMVQSF